VNKLKQTERIYKEIAEEDKKLCEIFLTISIETMENNFESFSL